MLTFLTKENKITATESKYKIMDRINKLRDKFEELTNIQPSIQPYPYSVDIIALDKKLKVSDGTSTREFIKQK